MTNPVGQGSKLLEFRSWSGRPTRSTTEIAWAPERQREFCSRRSNWRSRKLGWTGRSTGIADDRTLRAWSLDVLWIFVAYSQLLAASLWATWNADRDC